MRIQPRWSSPLALAPIFLLASSLAAQQAEIKKVPITPEQARNLDGQETYVTLCATCHGTLGQGNGPVANALKTRMPDLRRLAERNGGLFPTGRMRNSLSQHVGSIQAHGSADMPIWGAVFRSARGETWALVRMHNLLDYLESIQD